ncbi:extracellular solute-binding protein [Sanguibacter sp. 25GB23B1]|uniref:extracellular solute-binding protein n=1 Tax=unclassified Sanguibacter TaxID=2645534 RepID=UPI0032AF5AE7
MIGGTVQRRSKTLAVLAAAALVAPLAACGGGDDGTPVLTWYTNPDAGGQAAIAATCTEGADGAYRIVTSGLPTQAAAQREQLARRLAANDSSIDIMSLDPPFIPELAEPGFLAPMPDDVAEAVSADVVQGALDGATWKDELVTAPFWANTQLLWYRTSVAEAAGLDMTQPVTWDQIIDATEAQDALLAVQGAKAESLTVWVNALVASAGGSIVENPEAGRDEIALGLESDAGREAATILEKIGTTGVGGPALPTEDENASLTIFQGDEGSFMVNWPFVWAASQSAVEEGSLDQAVLDDIGWALYPRVLDDTETAPPYGGINLGVGAFSEHVDLAYDAVRCIVSPENQAEYFLTNGNPPANATAFDDPAVQEAFPMAATIRDSLELAVPRPQTPYYNEVSTGLQETWHPVDGVDPATTPGASADLIISVLRGEKLL